MCLLEASHGRLGQGGIKRDGMERVLVMKGSNRQAISRQVVNHVLWAREAANQEDCQNRIDVKALTGRGNLAKLRHEVARIDQIVAQMQELAQVTKEVPGLSIYLTLHQRSVSGYVFLRWRGRFGRNRHIAWKEVATLTKDLTQEMRSWCDEVSRRALQLNEAHLRSREMLKEIREDVERTPPHIFQRSIF